MVWEKHLEHWIVGLRTGWLDWFFILLSRIGTLGLVWIAIAVVLAVLRRRPSILAALVVADVAADLLAELGKVIVRRHRPFETQIGPPSSTHSFPSGHSATSFACATVLAALAPRYRGAFFVLAALIALSRLYNGMHYPTDVVAGSLLGLATGVLVLRALRQRGGGLRRSRPVRR